MSGGINGKGFGLGGLSQWIPRPSTDSNAPSKESAPAKGPESASSSKDRYVSSTDSVFEAKAAAPMLPASAKGLIKEASSLSELVDKVVSNEFPGLKLSPLERAKMKQAMTQDLAARGMTEDEFQRIKQQLK